MFQGKLEGHALAWPHWR